MDDFKKDDRIKPVPSTPDEEPEIYAVSKKQDGRIITRRAFLGRMGFGAAGAAAGLASPPRVSAEEAAPAEPEDNGNTVPQKIEKLFCGPFRAHEGTVSCLAVSPDGLVLASGSMDKTVKIWSLPDGRLIQTLNGHTEEVASLAFSPDNETLVSGGLDETVRFWSPGAGKAGEPLQRALRKIHAVAFSPDGKMLAFASQEEVNLWSFPKLEVIMTLSGHINAVTSLAFSPDGRYLASSSKDESIILWSMPDGKQVRSFNGHWDAVEAVTFTPDGKNLISVSWDGKIFVWSLTERRPISKIRWENNTVRTLCLSRDGTRIAAAGFGEIRLWSFPEGKELKSLEGHAGPVTALAFTADGRHLISGGEDQAIKLWTLPDGDPNWCLFDSEAAQDGTRVRNCRQTGSGTITLPCGTPVPAGATCICNCIASSLSYHVTTSVCVCDLISIPVGTALPGGTVCVCDLISLGTPKTLKGLPPGHKRRMVGTRCVCNTICTCNTVCACVGNVSIGSHYWRPN